MGNCSCNELNTEYVLKDEQINRIGKYININDKSSKITSSLMKIQNRKLHRAICKRKINETSDYFIWQLENNMISSYDIHNNKVSLIKISKMPFYKNLLDLSKLKPKQNFKIGNRSFLTTYYQEDQINLEYLNNFFTQDEIDIDNLNHSSNNKDFATLFNYKLGYYKTIKVNQLALIKLYKYNKSLLKSIQKNDNYEGTFETKELITNLLPIQPNFSFSSIIKIEYYYSKELKTTVFISLHSNNSLFAWILDSETHREIVIKVIADLSFLILLNLISLNSINLTSKILNEPSCLNKRSFLDTITSFDLCYDVNSHLDFQCLSTRDVQIYDKAKYELVVEEEIFMLSSFPQLAVIFFKFNKKTNSNDSSDSNFEFIKVIKSELIIVEDQAITTHIEEEKLEHEKKDLFAGNNGFNGSISKEANASTKLLDKSKDDENELFNLNSNVKRSSIEMTEKQNYMEDKETNKNHYFSLFRGPISYYNTYNKSYNILIYNLNKVIHFNLILIKKKNEIEGNDDSQKNQNYIVKQSFNNILMPEFTSATIMKIVKSDYKYIIITLSPNYIESKYVLILNSRLERKKFIEIKEMEKEDNKKNEGKENKESFYDLFSNQNINDATNFSRILGLLEESIFVDFGILTIMRYKALGINKIIDGKPTEILDLKNNIIATEGFHCIQLQQLLDLNVNDLYAQIINIKNEETGDSSKVILRKIAVLETKDEDFYDIEKMIPKYKGSSAININNVFDSNFSVEKEFKRKFMMLKSK